MADGRSMGRPSRRAASRAVKSAPITLTSTTRCMRAALIWARGIVWARIDIDDHGIDPAQIARGGIERDHVILARDIPAQADGAAALGPDRLNHLMADGIGVCQLIARSTPIRRHHGDRPPDAARTAPVTIITLPMPAPVTVAAAIGVVAM